MNDLASLLALSYKAERAASRRLALACGLSELEALRRTLTMRAGRQGLSALLDQRQAEQRLVRQRAEDRAGAAGRSAARRSAGQPGAASPWQAWFDGSAHPNPGRCGIGALLTGPSGQRIELAQAAGYGNSSEAEYRALIALLEAALAVGAHGLAVHGDSRVVIDDVLAPAHLAAPSLAPYRSAVHALLARLHDVSLRWIPRHKNGAADALSQRASALQAGADHA